MKNISRLRGFIQSFTHLVEKGGGGIEERIFKDGKDLLTELISHDDWLPGEFAQPCTEKYQQFLLYCDPLERFSVVSFVWGPGQTMPVHDHTVWGMVGVMRGTEVCEEFDLETGGHLRLKGVHQLPPGSVDLVSPGIGDIHKVSNALTDRTSISVHIYGANIGAVKRHIYDPETEHKEIFISGYSNNVIPNIWDCSVELAIVN